MHKAIGRPMTLVSPSGKLQIGVRGDLAGMPSSNRNQERKCIMPLDQEMKAEKEDQKQTTLASGRELSDNELESIIGAT
jgi:hypothetical protein